MTFDVLWQMSSSTSTPTLLYSQAFPIKGIWKALRPFLNREWAEYYFDLKDEKLWQKIDLSSATVKDDAFSLQVQVVHNDQYGVAKSYGLKNEPLVYKTCVNVVFRVVGTTWAFEFSPWSLNETMCMLMRHCNYCWNDNIGRICSPDNKWGLVMEYVATQDASNFFSWWQTIMSDKHIANLMKLTPKIPSTRYIEAIKEFYKKADPGKSSEDIDKVLAKYDSKHLTLMNMLWHKYGNHPLVSLKETIQKEEHEAYLARCSSGKSSLDDVMSAYDAKRQEQQIENKKQNTKCFHVLKEFINSIPKDITIPKWIHEGCDITVEEYSPSKRSLDEEQSIWYRSWTILERNASTNEIIKLREEYHLIKKTFSVSLPGLPPHLLLLHVTVDEGCICNNDPSCWIILEIKKLARKLAQFGPKTAETTADESDNSQYTIPNVFKIELEWNCSFFSLSKLFIPQYFIFDKELRIKYESELPEVCYLLPKKTLTTDDLSDYTVDVAMILPTNYFEIELFLLNASSMLTNGKANDNADDFEFIETHKGADLLSILKSVASFDNYPNRVNDETEASTVAKEDGKHLNKAQRK